MPTETELKLQLDSTALRRLRSHPLVNRWKLARPVTRRELSVYFDTPGFDLRNRKTVLRVRHIGRRRIQTLKTAGDPAAGGWSRNEWEWEIAGDQPDLAPLRSGELAGLFADDGLLQSLQPVFSTEVRRTAYRLGNGGWEVDLALDDGRVVAAGNEAPISEAELELKRGGLHQLFALARELHADIPGRLALLTKAQRGYALLEGSKPTPVKAAAVALARDLSAGEALRSIARACLSHYLANQDCLAASRDAEAIHQMRVALRRLRSAMNAFKALLDTPDSLWLREQLRWLSGRLGQARDIDVFIADILQPVAGNAADAPGLASLLADFEARRGAAHAEVLGLLEDPRSTDLLLRLAEWSEGGDWLDSGDADRRMLLDQPAKALGQATLTSRHRKVRRAMRRLRELDPAQRHRLRINVKKLRYAVDFFSSLYPRGKPKKMVAALGAVQDRLGLLNDIATSCRRLKTHAEETADPERLWAAGIIAGWHAAHVDDLLDQAAENWKTYDRLARPWQP